MTTLSCNCETVKFQITQPLQDVYVCHCSICRKTTGSQGIAVLIVANSHFKWLQGQDNIATWQKPDTDWQTWFCKTCGSKLPGDNDRARKFIPAGLLPDDVMPLKVAHHIWVESKAQWDEICDSGVQHPKEYGSAEPL